MKKFTIAGAWLIALFFNQLPLHAQFSIEAQLRCRAEMRQGYQKLAAEDAATAWLISQRSRLSFNYNNEKLRLRFTPQDVRIWGDEAKLNNGTGDNPSLDVLEAYAELKTGASSLLSVGRQQLVYDNRRLLGDRNWNQNSIAYDAIVFRSTGIKTSLHAGLSWNTLNDKLSDNPYPASRIKTLNFIWLNYKFSDKLTVSLMHISSGVTKTDTTNALYFRHTTGFYATYSSKTAGAMANAYYQYGISPKGYSISAFLIDAELWAKGGKLSPGAGFSYFSGNKTLPTAGKTDHLFDQLYGNRHKFFGGMDYFSSMATNTKQGGLTDIYLWLHYKPVASIIIKNTLHYFALAQTNSLTPAGRDLGIENDLTARIRLSPWGELEGGYCFFVPKSYLNALQQVANDRFSHFMYLMFTLTPELFKQPSAK